MHCTITELGTLYGSLEPTGVGERCLTTLLPVWLLRQSPTTLQRLLLKLPRKFIDLRCERRSKPFIGCLSEQAEQQRKVLKKRRWEISCRSDLTPLSIRSTAASCRHQVLQFLSSLCLCCCWLCMFYSCLLGRVPKKMFRSQWRLVLWYDVATGSARLDQWLGMVTGVIWCRLTIVREWRTWDAVREWRTWEAYTPGLVGDSVNWAHFDVLKCHA